MFGRQTNKYVWMLLAVLMLMFAATACRSPQSSIVGKWEADDGIETWEFFKDGTVSVSGGWFPVAGNYKFIDRNHMRIDFGGLGALAGPQVFEVDISGNRLILKSERLGTVGATRIQ